MPESIEGKTEALFLPCCTMCDHLSGANAPVYKDVAQMHSHAKRGNEKANDTIKSLLTQSILFTLRKTQKNKNLNQTYGRDRM